MLKPPNPKQKTSNKPPHPLAGPQGQTWHLKLAFIVQICAIAALTLSISNLLTTDDSLSSTLTLDDPSPFIKHAKHTAKVKLNHSQLLHKTYIVDTALAAILFFATTGIRLRKFPAIKMALLWATLKIIYAITWSYFSFPYLLDLHTNAPIIFPSLQQAGSQPAPQTLALLHTIITTIWLSALPIFIIYYFNRPNIKPEILSWATPPQNTDSQN